jgi:hypothetical protein
MKNLSSSRSLFRAATVVALSSILLLPGALQAGANRKQTSGAQSIEHSGAA